MDGLWAKSIQLWPLKENGSGGRNSKIILFRYLFHFQVVPVQNIIHFAMCFRKRWRKLTRCRIWWQQFAVLICWYPEFVRVGIRHTCNCLERQVPANRFNLRTINDSINNNHVYSAYIKTKELLHRHSKIYNDTFRIHHETRITNPSWKK